MMWVTVWGAKDLLAMDTPLGCRGLRQERVPSSQVSSILFGDTMVPSIEKDSILPVGYSILYKEYYLTRFNHQKNTTQVNSKP